MGAPHHAPEVRDRMIGRISTGEKMKSLAKETGIPRSTLSRWWQEAGRVGPMSNSTDGADERFTDEEKQRILQTATTLSETELGAYLRREGVTENQLKRWQTQVLAALERPKRRQRKTDAERQLREENRALKRELRRKEKALAEAAALLVLKKKAQAIWGADEDGNTDGETD